MVKIVGSVIDSLTGQLVSARIHAKGSNGDVFYPNNTIKKVGPGLNAFYSDGEFILDVPPGETEIIVEKGTEYLPSIQKIILRGKASKNINIFLNRWEDLSKNGWYSGNTHIHYDQNEKNPDMRLSMEPKVNDLNVTILSILERWDIPYASNKYPIGFMNSMSSAHHIVDIGEESRHNVFSQQETYHQNRKANTNYMKDTIGYGHVMFVNLSNKVSPLSRGLLVDESNPDYPPLAFACDKAREQKGIVIWCHNGAGMEAPICAALGKLDAFNLFDPNWMEPEYDVYYELLNCGFKFPVSTGSDWYVCSNNRVYTNIESEFSYRKWLDGLLTGNTFITNGPALFLSAEDKIPGQIVEKNPDESVDIKIELSSGYPIHNIELLFNGDVIKEWTIKNGSTKLHFNEKCNFSTDGWLIARCSSKIRDSFFQPIFAHTSPIYIKTGKKGNKVKISATRILEKITHAEEWINVNGKFKTLADKKKIQDLYTEGKNVFLQISKK